jgi:hypothetical protein
MTLLFIEGAGVDATAWDNSGGSRVATVGRYGDAGIISLADTANIISKVITPSADAYIGVAAFCATNAPNGGNRVISVSNADGGEQTRVWLASTTELRVSRLDGTQLATYTIPTSVQNRWVYYEVYFKIGTTPSSVRSGCCRW